MYGDGWKTTRVKGTVREAVGLRQWRVRWDGEAESDEMLVSRTSHIHAAGLPGQ